MATNAGTYKLEVWGAQGNDYYGGKGGRGGYSKGYIYINNIIYLCVGNCSTYDGSPDVNKEGYNGGAYASGGVSGGGATSITQTNRGELMNFINYKSDVIIVAGGGGGAEGGVMNGGAGGGLIGKSPIFNTSEKGEVTLIPTGGSQYQGGAFGKCHGLDGVNGSFGEGGIAPFDCGGSGGGGWYGGGTMPWYGGGGGGSSYVDGVKQGQTIDGESIMPSPNGGMEIGHTGNGYCLITQISF